jgi:hypothetical protein
MVSDTGYSIDHMFGYYWDVYEYYLAGGYRQNLTEFTYGVLWQDWEIPAPTAHNYTTGWLYQRRGSDYGFRRYWSPALMLDNERLIFDFNGSKAFSTMHNGWRYAAPREINLNLTADRDYIEGMMDWSFVDDFDDGYVFEVDGDNVIAADTDNDGDDDWGFGAFFGRMTQEATMECISMKHFQVHLPRACSVVSDQMVLDMHFYFQLTFHMVTGLVLLLHHEVL